MTLSDAWEQNAAKWLAWARRPDHDSYARFHRDAFFELLAPPGAKTLDLGSGEGRVTRDLAQRGHSVVGLELSPTLIAAARELSPELEFVQADAAALPFADETFDLVLAFMSLQDIDDMEGAIRESARVLMSGGAFCAAVVHPLNSAGAFATDDPASPFLIAGSYFDRRRYTEEIERDRLTMTFVSDHRSFADYVNPVLDAGLVLDRVREVSVTPDRLRSPASERWLRIPLFLHLRAHKP